MALKEISASEAIRRARNKPPRGGTIPKNKLEIRTWAMVRTFEGSETAAILRARRSKRRPVHDLVARTERAQALVMLGEFSSGFQALEGAAVAPGTDHALHLLTDSEKIPPSPPNPVRVWSPEMLEFIPTVPFCM